MKNKKSAGLPVVGVSALLTIFAVLCLTVFTLLSVATVQADLRLARQARLSVTVYNVEEHKAHQILARLRAGEEVEGVERDANRYRFVRPVGSIHRQLAVEVELDGTDYRILQWQLQPTQEWANEEELPVWNGEKEG